MIFVKADLLLKEVFETCDELSLEIEEEACGKRVMHMLTRKQLQTILEVNKEKYNKRSINYFLSWVDC